ncbi:hypothetical protein NQ117_15465 [Paenibacillus sp. SC116]|uniref:hypothetical protein n=1 Tax=Paenibacillus sp. SC116 TaxID=2968986 RepID=UPI00215A693B|nr:hypothetical protein [Paenibacillus sp. SC116]MCR8845080.1 hypothetical protein [Paenibacillus sp. SC116]
MKRSDLFYIWVAITSYLTGLLVYISYLLMYDGRVTESLGKIITWTAPAFFTVGILLYATAVVILHLLKKYNFWSQTVVFILIGVIPVSIIPFTMGYFSINNFSFIFSPEGFQFLLAYSSIGLIFSYGVWVARQKKDKKPFLLLSILIILLLILVNYLG